jgi:hypothetical protein
MEALIRKLEEATGPLSHHDATGLAFDIAAATGLDADPLYRALRGSLDAALTLVPEGWRTDTVYQTLDGRRWTWALRKLNQREGAGTAGNAPLPALAVCIASLRAQESRE